MVLRKYKKIKVGRNDACLTLPLLPVYGQFAKIAVADLLIIQTESVELKKHEKRFLLAFEYRSHSFNTTCMHFYLLIFLTKQ